MRFVTLLHTFISISLLSILSLGAVPATAQSGPVAERASGFDGPLASRPESPASAPTAASQVEPARRWAKVLRVPGRLKAVDLGLVINEDDPYSVKVGEYYIKARKIPDANVLRIRLPVKPSLSRAEFEVVVKAINDHLGDKIQALALAWRMPYAVECNGLTGALAMGFDAKLCQQTCAASRPSRYYGGYSSRPYRDTGMRLAMHLAAKDVEQAQRMIDRGVSSDGTLGLRGAPLVNVHMVTTSDKVRSQRQMLFPPAGKVAAAGIDVHLDQTDAVRDVSRVLMYLTGKDRVDGLNSVQFVPGALADHLTSYGGMLDGNHGQMTALSWIEAGATATYGTASEPCAHLQKFPHPQALLLFYLGGATAIEAYWKSVAWPQQGVFVGEPLAAPFGR